jgi:S1/P1 Nuclease
MMNTNGTLVLLLLLAYCAVGTKGWGTDGHELVGNLAYRLLSSETQAAVQAILVNHTHGNNTPLGAVADWADQVRISKEYHWSGSLHYIDIHDEMVPGGCPAGTTPKEGCHFDYQRDCSNDVCVAGAIVNYTHHLADWKQKSLRVSRRLKASADLVTPFKWWWPFPSISAPPIPTKLVQDSLKFLTHFIGDIHQPLHSARQSDKGGNSIAVTFTVPSRQLAAKHHHHSLELHAVWDSSIIQRAVHTTYQHVRQNMEEDLMDYIDKAHRAGETKQWLACSDSSSTHCTSAWAEESWQDALQFAYLNADEHSEITSGTHLSDLYYESRWPVVFHCLAVAGVRLAASLELVLGTTTTDLAG